MKFKTKDCEIIFNNLNNKLQVQIKTPHLLLQSICEEDKNNYYTLYGDAEVVAKFHTGVPKSKHDVDIYLSTWLNDWALIKPFGAFSVFLLKDNAPGDFIGTIAPDHKGDNPGEAELAYLLMKEHQGKGYGKEMVNAVLNNYIPLAISRKYDPIIRGEPFTRVVATSRIDNGGSKKILEANMRACGEPKDLYGAKRQSYFVTKEELANRLSSKQLEKITEDGESQTSDKIRNDQNKDIKIIPSGNLDSVKSEEFNRHINQLQLLIPAITEYFNNQKDSHNNDTTAAIKQLIIGGLISLITVYLANKLANKAQQNKQLLNDGINQECKESVLLNDQLLHDSHVADCQTRLLFYNEKQNIDVEKQKQWNVRFSSELIKNRLIQHRLRDLIASAKDWGGSFLEKGTIKRANELLEQQKNQYYRLLLAKKMNKAILLHKQGQYEEAYQTIQVIKKIHYETFDPTEEDKIYLPDKESNKKFRDEHSFYSETCGVKELQNRSNFVKNAFINAFNIEGMVIRSLYQSNRNLLNYTLVDAAKSFKLAMDVKRNPAVLSNLAFLLNKMASEDRNVLPENDRNTSGNSSIEISPQTDLVELTLQTADEKLAKVLKGTQLTKQEMSKLAFYYHQEAYQKKANDENDAALFNGVAWGIVQCKDFKNYEQALGFFNRALALKPNERNILVNKANLLIEIAEEIEKNGNKEFFLAKERYLKQAGACLEEVIETNDELADAFYLVAKINYKLGKYDEALAYLNIRSKNISLFNDQQSTYDEANVTLLRSNLEAKVNNKEASQAYFRMIQNFQEKVLTQSLVWHSSPPFFAKPNGTSKSHSGAKNWRRSSFTLFGRCAPKAFPKYPVLRGTIVFAQFIPALANNISLFHNDLTGKNSNMANIQNKCENAVGADAASAHTPSKKM